jgi:ketosteroid isomerase-like protein
MREIVSLVVFAGLLFARADGGGVSPALQELVDTERAFARSAVQKGIRDSFLEYFADDAISIAPAPKPAKPEIQSRPSRPFSELELTWEPRTGDVAASGDLGWLTGPSTFIDHTASAPQPRYGNYLSIWRREPAGQWRVLIDIGCQVPEPASFAPGFVALALEHRWSGRSGDASAASSSLTAADRSLNTALAGGRTAEAYAAVLADTSRLHRPGVALHTGRDAIVSWLEQQPHRTTTAHSTAAHTAAAGDLGYGYGLYEIDTTPAQRGAYLRVWARDAGGRWWLMADVTEPAR